MYHVFVGGALYPFLFVKIYSLRLILLILVFCGISFKIKGKIKPASSYQLKNKWLN